MSDFGEVWKTLSAIDCSERIEKKGNLSYLSWAWAWGILMKHYPEAEHEVLPEVSFPDGTMEVWCKIKIGDHSRSMWLPIMDNRNNAVTNPNARAISDARMRCLVKCLALFGLGHYIYAGEDLPQKPSLTEDEAQEFRDLVNSDDADPLAVLKISHEAGEEKLTEMFNSAKHGKKGELKDNYRTLTGRAHAMLDKYAHEITELANNDDPAAMQYASELEPFEKTMVWARLDAITKQKVKAMAKQELAA